MNLVAELYKLAISTWCILNPRILCNTKISSKAHVAVDHDCFKLGVSCTKNNYGSVLWEEKVYTVKFSLSAKEILRTKTEGFPEDSGFISPYIPTRDESQYRYSQLQFQYCPSLESNIGRVDSSYCSGSWGYNFHYTPSFIRSVLENIPPALLGLYFPVNSH